MVLRFTVGPFAGRYYYAEGYGLPGQEYRGGFGSTPHKDCAARFDASDIALALEMLPKLYPECKSLLTLKAEEI